MNTSTDSFTDIERARALASFLRVDLDEVVENGPRWGAPTDYFAIIKDDEDGGVYEVHTDAEADQRWEEALESYLEECVYPELPELARRYFEEEAWKRDARSDGRGHAIAHYDREDHDAVDPVTGEQYVIIRIG